MPTVPVDGGPKPLVVVKPTQVPAALAAALRTPRQTQTTTHKEVSHGVPGWVCLVFTGCHLVF